MSDKFPARTVASDDAAYLVKVALDEAKRLSPHKIGDFMVSVVTSHQNGCFVGISGDRDDVATILNEQMTHITQKLVEKDRDFYQHQVNFMRRIFFTQLDEYIDAQFSADKLGTREEVRRSSLKGTSIVYQVLDADLRHMNLQFMVPKIKQNVIELQRQKNLLEYGKRAQGLRYSIETGKVDLQKPPEESEKAIRKGLKPNWNCSEPKALALAAKSGQGMEGMTTFWFGDLSDEVRHYALADRSPLSKKSSRTLQLCRPCETCSRNEYRIMANVSILELIKRGGGKKTYLSVEAPGSLPSKK